MRKKEQQRFIHHKLKLRIIHKLWFDKERKSVVAREIKLKIAATAIELKKKNFQKVFVVLITL